MRNSCAENEMWYRVMRSRTVFDVCRERSELKFGEMKKSALRLLEIITRCHGVFIVLD